MQTNEVASARDTRAALAMWWSMAAEWQAEFRHWHSHEHFHERLALPGFERASRWRAADGERFFVLYELSTFDALGSAEYRARLDAPTPWSRKLMPQHRDMVRCPARMVWRSGALVGAHMLTLRGSGPVEPDDGARARAASSMAAMLQELPSRAGLTGACFLQTELPSAAAPTTEQQLRGLRDRAADWIVLVAGYDEEALRALPRSELADARLSAAGLSDGAASRVELFALDASMLAAEAASAHLGGSTAMDSCKTGL